MNDDITQSIKLVIDNDQDNYNAARQIVRDAIERDQDPAARLEHYFSEFVEIGREAVREWGMRHLARISGLGYEWAKANYRTSDADGFVWQLLQSAFEQIDWAAIASEYRELIAEEDSYDAG